MTAPTAPEIVSPTLRRLHGDWLGRLRGRAMPARRDFDILDFKYILGDLNLLAVERDPLRFRFRVHATNATVRLGFDLTGRTVDDYPDPDYRAMVGRAYEEVVETRAPHCIVQMSYQLPDKILSYEVLILPLSDDGSDVNMLMVGFSFR
jgi:hypothetical protein